jgi:hypothetical protein
VRTMDAIGQRLQDQGVATPGTTLFAGSDVNIPPGPGPILTIAETPGQAPIGAHNTTSIRQPAPQITARGDEYPAVAALLELAYTALGGTNGLSNILIGDVFFLWLRPAGEPFQLPNDAQGRVRLAFNVKSARR